MFVPWINGQTATINVIKPAEKEKKEEKRKKREAVSTYLSDFPKG